MLSYLKKNLHIFRVRCRPNDRFFVWSTRLLATLFSRHRLAREIWDLRTRAVVISERHAWYGLSREALSRSSSLAPAPRATTHALRAANDPDQFVGISEQAKLLAVKVEKMDDNKESKVFSVVGFGGLGKTTLAMEGGRQLEASFDRQAQVSVSQTFDGRKDLQALLKRVLQQVVKMKPNKEKGIKEEDSLTPGDIDKMDLAGLTSTIEEKLKDKRYEYTHICFLAVLFSDFTDAYSHYD
ncbi:hypothetical protein ACQ4PT_056445 [Festuca glaucescens]